MNAKLQKAMQQRGIQAQVSRLTGMSPAQANHIATGVRPVPVIHAAQIERVTGISRKEMFPETWQKIWPELADKEQAHV